MISRISIAAALSLALAGAAQAQLPPQIKVIVPYAPGGSVDLLSRLLGEQVGRARGVTVITENKPGASTIIGTEQLARATPDGSTIGFVANSFIINAQIRKLSYDPLTSFEPLCHLVDSPQVIVVNAKSPYKTLDDFLAAVRAKPGEYSIGALGPATTQHVAVAMFLKTAKLDMNFVPFQGGAPASQALLGGHVTSIIGNYSEVSPQVDAGELRILATTAASRIAPLPEVPTVREKGLDFEVTAWFALLATGKTPAPVVSALIDAYSSAMKTPEMQARLKPLQLYTVNNCGAGFADFLRRQNDVMGPVVREAGIKLD